MKDQYLALKVADDERQILEKACKLERRTMSSFVGKAALDRAKEVLADG